MSPRIVIFGDPIGLPRLLASTPRGQVVAAVRAGNRPDQDRTLNLWAYEQSLHMLVQPRWGSDDYPGFVAQLQTLGPELILVDSYALILRAEVLAMPRLGCFNVHPSLLPAYRGPNPIQWALVNDERHIGVTLHHMVEEVDAGAIVAQRRIPVAIDDTWVTLLKKVDGASRELLSESMPALVEGRSRSRPQDETSATRYPRRGPEDGEIDWDAPVIEIHNLVRALIPPLPGAYYLNSQQQAVVIGRYHTVGEVITKKYRQAGPEWLRGERLRLAPRGSRTNRAIEFDVTDASGRALGRAGVRDIDWMRRTASLVAPTELGAKPEQELWLLLERFCHRELSLSSELTRPMQGKGSGGALGTGDSHER